MSAYNESNSSASMFYQAPQNLNPGNIVSSPTTSRSGMEADNNAFRSAMAYNITNSTCPETNVARYADSSNIAVRVSTDEEIFEMDHSVSISKDIGKFFNDTKLYDYVIKVKKTLTPATNQAIFVSDSLVPTLDKTDTTYETFRCHKIVLAARCPYYQTQFLNG